MDKDIDRCHCLRDVVTYWGNFSGEQTACKGCGDAPDDCDCRPLNQLLEMN